MSFRFFQVRNNICKLDDNYQVLKDRDIRTAIKSEMERLRQRKKSLKIKYEQWGAVLEAKKELQRKLAKNAVNSNGKKSPPEYCNIEHELKTIESSIADLRIETNAWKIQVLDELFYTLD